MNTRDAANPRDPERDELILRNIELVRSLARAAVQDGDDPLDVIDRACDNFAGFVRGTTAMIVPPDLWDADERDAMIAKGRELAARYGW